MMNKTQSLVSMGYLIDIQLYFFFTIYFDTILDLQKSCKDSTEFSYHLQAAFSNINTLYNHGTISETKKFTLLYQLQISM